jgi:hypothetical protein
MIERLALPDPTLVADSRIDAVSGLTLDRMHNFWNREGSIAIRERCENQVYVIRHHYRCMQCAFPAVSVDTCFQRQVAGGIRKYPRSARSERDE